MKLITSSTKPGENRPTGRESARPDTGVTVGGSAIDILNRRVRAGDTELHLTSLEQSLLYLLAANGGRLLMRDEILAFVFRVAMRFSMSGGWMSAMSPHSKRERRRSSSAGISCGDHLWGAGYVAESNIVDRHIRNLRIKLQNQSRRPRYIETGSGRGYLFVPTRADAAPHSPPSERRRPFVHSTLR